MKQCLKCGREFGDDLNFCLYDGDPLGSAPSSSTASSRQSSQGQTRVVTSSRSSSPQPVRPQGGTPWYKFAFAAAGGAAVLFVTLMLMAARMPSQRPTGYHPVQPAQQPYQQPQQPYQQPQEGGVSEQELSALLDRAARDESNAVRNLDVGPLADAYTGAALTEVEGEVAQLRSNGVYAIVHRNSVLMQDTAEDDNGAHSTVTETWQIEYHSMQTGQLMGPVSQQNHTQFVHFVRGANGWLINKYVNQ